MGGIGSGRRAGWGRNTVEQKLCLDISYLRGRGLLKAGVQGDFVWRDGKRQLGRVRVEGSEHQLVITLLGGGAGHSPDGGQLIAVAYQPLPFGGARPYFLCPGVPGSSECARRVGRLYIVEGRIVCRHCAQLRYTSQRATEFSRAVRQGDRIRSRLGGQTGWTSPIPQRPKGMWRRTYERAFAKWVEQEIRLDDALDELHEKVRRLDLKLGIDQAATRE